MAYVRQARVNRIKQMVIAACIVAAILLFLFLGIPIANMILHKDHNISIKPNIEQTKQVNLLRASQRLQAGESADVAKFEIAAVPKELAPDGAVNSVQLLNNKRVTETLEKGEFLLQSNLVDSTAWYEEGDRLMEHTFQDGVIPAAVDIGSVVDIKLFRQGSEDTVVISKAAVISKAENTLGFYLNATEQEYLKEAHAEGTLFLVIYLDKAQPASTVTYYPPYEKGLIFGRRAEGFTASSMNKE